ncbi:MAG: sugar phosphate isomerase/epimerase family protein [Thermoguttaceae bacterium]|jgi:sugar phosphate isomerase/epimerase
MFLGYNTNGMAHHDLFQAVGLLAEFGYRGVAITIDHGPLWPDKGSGRNIVRLKKMLRDLGLRSAIETGARFLLDPRVKHEPTLISADPRRRIEFYKYAVDLAAELGSDCVSLCSGAVRDGISPGEALKRLTQGLRQVLDYAAGQGVVIAMEPEPGMLIDSTKNFDDFLKHNDMPNLRLTLDIGHLHCQGERPIAEIIRRWAGRLVNVHVEDMRAGVHEHLMFGEGQIEFPPVITALAEWGYPGGLYVELNRHSREGPIAAKKAFDFLSQFAELR